MTPERFEELKNLCQALEGDYDLRSIPVSDIRWLIAEMERLRDMICCERCGDSVEDPHIDEYGEGPICDACLEEKEDTT